jgi:signal transduction histidine kinase
MAEVRDGSRPKLRLRWFTIGAAVVLTGLTLVACVSLKMVTDILERRAQSLRAAAHQVHTAEAVRADLLGFSRLSTLIHATHDKTREKERVDLERRLGRDFEDLQRSALPHQKALIDKTDADLRAYFVAHNQAEASGGAPIASLVEVAGPIEAALASLEEVVRADSAEVAAEEARIQRWSNAGDQIGWGVAAFVLLGTAIVLLFNYKVVFQPLFDLANAMKRFTAGRRDSRAKPSPAIELATAADNFNEMADLITRQHSEMLDFLGGAAHEVMGPVQLMRIAIDDLMPPKPLPAPDKARARLAVIQRELDRLEREVRSNLDASRIEWERLDLQQDREDVRALVKDAVQLYQNFSNVHDVELSSPQRPVCVYGDPKRLSQVFQTLIANAIERSPRGGLVKVGVDAGHEGQAQIDVTDFGGEVPKEELQKLFEPFRQVSAELRGTGAVALSTARRIAEAHGGRIDAWSKAGEGTTFRVRLPLATQPARKAPAPPPRNDKEAQPPREAQPQPPRSDGAAAHARH